MFFILLWIFLIIATASSDEIRPYEFSFNIEDFQHRYEKKDSEGIITGEFGFITADGVYHETNYATDKNGGFRITKMKNRKITSLQIAEEIFYDKPEIAKKVIQVLAKSCSGCGIPVHESLENRKINKTEQRKLQTRYEIKEISEPIPEDKKIKTIGNGDRKMADRIEAIVEGNVEGLKNEVFDNVEDNKISRVVDEINEITSNDFNYRFNYTITSHGHEETGYRDGKKDGSYRTLGINGTDLSVDYLSNEFGHQPNITFINVRADGSNATEMLKEFIFEWFFDRR